MDDPDDEAVFESTFEDDFKRNEPPAFPVAPVDGNDAACPAGTIAASLPGLGFSHAGQIERLLSF